MKIENKLWVLRMALAGALSLGLATVAKADTRLDSLGADVRAVEDIDSIFLYANQVLQYKDTVDFRLNVDGNNSGWGNGIKEWGGVIHNFSDDFGTVAIYVNRPNNTPTVAGSLFNAGTTHLLPGNQIFAASNSTVGGAGNVYAPKSDNADVFWGKSSFMGIGDVALHLTYGDDENPVSADKYTSQVWGLSLGLGLGPWMGFSQTNVHVDYAEDFVQDNNGKTPLGDNGIYTLKLGALAQTDLNANDALRLFIDGQYDNDSLPTGWFAAQQAANDYELLLGASIKHAISSKGFVSTGLELEYDNVNPSTTNTDVVYSAIWNGCVESALTSWLTMRAGLDKAIINQTYVQGAAVNTMDNSLTQAVGLGNNNVAFNVGFGINVENWMLDTNVKVEDLENGIGSFMPGQGILFTGGNVLTITEADLRYKF
jgi:hypothetical protein